MNKRSYMQLRWGPTKDELPVVTTETFEAWRKTEPVRESRRVFFESIPKWALYEAALHLAALAHSCGSYDEAIDNGGAEERLEDELLLLGLIKRPLLVREGEQ